jgi:chemotaxis protein methyltransferase CheR
MANQISELELIQLRHFLNEKLGLNFLINQEKELVRKMEFASNKFGFSDLSAFIQWLIEKELTDDQIGDLACHLTIGETYFMREKKGYEFLEQIYLPELIVRRDSGNRRLNIWCAGCATGEEAYSLAITLFKAIPNIEKWKISILATDINTRFLEKAKIAEYTKWSFRSTSPEFKTKFFEYIPPDKFKVREPIRNLVKVTQFNLANDQYKVLLKDGLPFDIIFCRNVLIYFSSEGITSVSNKLFEVLVPKGVLIVSPVEVSNLISKKFDTILFSGFTIYHKGFVKKDQKNISTDKKLEFGIKQEPEPQYQVFDKLKDQSLLKVETPTSVPVNEEKSIITISSLTGNVTKEDDEIKKESLFEIKNEETYTPIDKLTSLYDKLLLEAKGKANLGDLNEAKLLCERALSVNKLEPAIYYLLATILQEQGDDQCAIQNLKMALYLDFEFVLAHFLMGTIAIKNGKTNAGKKSLNNALALLSRYKSDDILPESDGITAGRFKEMILAISA